VKAKLDPIGLCIISPSYEKVGREAVKRFQEKTGLECKVHETDDGPEAFRDKLQLERIAGRRPFCFFDSDLWFLDRPEFSFGHPTLLACHDSGTTNPSSFPHTDCERFNLDKTAYINTGLIIVDTREERHREWFAEARRLFKRGQRRKAVKPVDWTDQIWLNMAKANVGIPWARLPSAYNFYLFEAIWGQQPWIPRNIIGLHGAGIKAKDKFRKLKEQAKVFEYPSHPMQAEAAAFEMARMIHLR